MAAQLHKARIPRDDVAIAARDRRAQIVIDALARHATEPAKRADVALQERLDRHVKAEMCRRGARVGQ